MKKEEQESKTLKWRLSERPSPDNILKLVEGGIITKEEAKGIILDEVSVSESEVSSVKEELALLRKLILDSTTPNNVLIKIIEKSVEPYHTWGWTLPYTAWCGNSNAMLTATNGSYTTTAEGGMGTGTINLMGTVIN
jgi:hypothetical protein